ncbi:hypothetical protein GZ77_05150 [Endozoicomonas montiporae]|uniref:Uncharacterized protein n=2 Tax=Endozoicomonas montiporae TaxID=1027273 RepID=A0A081NBS5_9GAMM|nr:hypothetical protein [Endozoicomonas montiporae]AMO56202.1 hypothetical protein EZMO1_2083 [Endozoicomonas montiporae CL-33]KEQ15898.1 hypothetical protein GZ77_05150 [Endozoicomonas montiporae]
MYFKLDVNVYSEGELLEIASDRPARSTPEGVLGVVYRGMVYPVYKTESDELLIKLDDNSYERDCCDFWDDSVPRVYASAPTPELPKIKWYIESNFYGHYFVFDGDEKLLKELLNNLEYAEFCVIRSGVSFRPADDGYQYDWFIRIDKNEDRDGLIEFLESLLSSAHVLSEPAESTNLMAEVLKALPDFLRDAVKKKGLDNSSVQEIISWLGTQFCHIKDETEAAKQQIVELRHCYLRQ